MALEETFIKLLDVPFGAFFSSPPEVLLISGTKTVKVKSLGKRRQRSLGNNSDPGRKGKRMGHSFGFLKARFGVGQTPRAKRAHGSWGGCGGHPTPHELFHFRPLHPSPETEGWEQEGRTPIPEQGLPGWGDKAWLWVAGEGSRGSPDPSGSAEPRRCLLSSVVGLHHVQ